VVDVPASGRAIEGGSGDPSKGDAFGVKITSMPFELNPDFKAIFSHMLARWREPRSETISGDVLPISVWRRLIAVLT